MGDKYGKKSKVYDLRIQYTHIHTHLGCGYDEG